MELTRRNVMALLAALAPSPAFAAPYPDRPVRMVVPLAPGGPADTAARVFGPYLSAALGQSVFIENRAGASSVIGTESVVRATPDGYTLLFGSSSTFAVNPAVMKRLRFDTLKELKLIGLVSYTPHVLVVRTPLGVDTLGDLIKLAKRQPSKLTYASSGAGGAIHLASELFKRDAGVELLHVPYRGGGPALIGLLSNDVDVFINDVSTVLPNIQSGKLKALAMAWPKRSPLLPEVATFGELGLPSMISSSWSGLAAPAATLPDILARLDAALRQALAAPEYHAALKRIGLELFDFNAEQTTAFIKTETEKWSALAKSANIQVD